MVSCRFAVAQGKCPLGHPWPTFSGQLYALGGLRLHAVGDFAGVDWLATDNQMYTDLSREAVNGLERHATPTAKPLAYLGLSHTRSPRGLGLADVLDSWAQGFAELILEVSHRIDRQQGRRTPSRGGLAGWSA